MSEPDCLKTREIGRNCRRITSCRLLLGQPDRCVRMLKRKTKGHNELPMMFVSNNGLPRSLHQGHALQGGGLLSSQSHCDSFASSPPIAYDGRRVNGNVGDIAKP